MRSRDFDSVEQTGGGIEIGILGSAASEELLEKPWAQRGRTVIFGTRDPNSGRHSTFANSTLLSPTIEHA